MSSIMERERAERMQEIFDRINLAVEHIKEGKPDAARMELRLSQIVMRIWCDCKPIEEKYEDKQEGV